MGILHGALTARRFRVVGDLPSDWRDSFREQLERMKRGSNKAAAPP